MREWTFEMTTANAPNGGYAANWEEMKAENIGYLMGQGRHRQELFCRVYRQRPHGERGFRVHDEFCLDTQ